MSLKILSILLVVIAFASSGCTPQSVSSQTENTSSKHVTEEIQPLLKPTPEDEKPLIEEMLFDEKKLAYKDFVVEKRVRKVKDDFGSGSPPITVDVNYAVLKHKGKVVAEYDDDIYFGAGNGLSFGFFSFLGGEEKQLIVSQDIFRGGNQWIVDLSSNKPKTIFDGSDFYVGREGADLTIIDIDGNGVYEIMAMWTFFYGFLDMSLPSSAIPIPNVIFKYDVKTKKYLPANAQFENYALKDIVQLKEDAKQSNDQFSHFGKVMDVVLNYILVGKEKEAWAFYKEYYKQNDESKSLGFPDKEKIKASIKKELRAHPLYRFIYRGKKQG